MYNHRQLCQIIGREIVVEEEALDIFYTDTTLTPLWVPSIQLKSYTQLRQVVLDIETTGLDSSSDRIIAIGCMRESGSVEIFMEEDEASVLKSFLNYLSSVNPEVLLTYNGLNFDLPFIIDRLDRLGIKHLFKQSKITRTINSARVFGTPIKLQEVFYKSTNHVDVYICVLRWDFIAKSLSLSHTLKNVALEMRLRSESRLTLSYQQIQDCWQQGEGSQGWQNIQQYLQFDLEDIKLITDKIVPQYWYEALIVPGMNLQQLALAGNATKWQRVLEHKYRQSRPSADPKYTFAGGLCVSIPGIYRQVAKVDVSSLYPSIMLKYGICSRKDSKRVALSILKYLTEERLKLKAIAKQGDAVAKQAEGALKVLINSLFGFYGTGGVGFNDMEAAALITAYGRRILRHMISVIESAGGIQIESDTDGVFFSHPEPEAVFATLKQSMPEGINIELETQGNAMFVPTRGTKNYILWHNDGSLTLKGNYRQRDRSVLEKQFPINYLTHFLCSFQAAEDYYHQVERLILSGQLLREQIQVTRKIKANEKALLTLGQAGESITFYQGINGATTTGDYSVGYYLNLIAKKRSEILEVVMPVESRNCQQLSLF